MLVPYYEQYFQRLNCKLRCNEIRRWLFRNYCGFCNYLGFDWAMLRLAQVLYTRAILLVKIRELRTTDIN